MATRTQAYKKLGATRVQAVTVDCRNAAIDDDCTVGGTLSIGGTAVNATAAELNNVADVSARSVAAGATLTVVEATHQGKLIKLDTAAGSIVTLPASTGSGALYRFAVSVIATSNSHIIKVANATDVLRGCILNSDSDTSDAFTGFNTTSTSDTITLNRSTTGSVVVGEYIEIQDVAAGFFSVRGWVSGTGTVATPFSATVS